MKAAAFPPLMAFMVWALGNYFNTPIRPNADVQDPTVEAKRPRRYRPRHVANRKRDTR